jgi:hypothetical protein
MVLDILKKDSTNSYQNYLKMINQDEKKQTIIDCLSFEMVRSFQLEKLMFDRKTFNIYQRLT